MKDWISCQIDENEIFQLSNKTTDCWKLASYPGTAKGGQSLCRVGYYIQNVVAIGGWDGGCTLKSC